MVREAAILIDGGYLDNVNRDFFSSARIDFLKFSEEISTQYLSGMPIFRSYYYDAPPWNGAGADPKWVGRRNSFHSAISKLDGYMLRMGRLKKIANNPLKFVQKGVDVLIAIDIVKLSNQPNISHIVLISGDTDLAPAIKVASDNYKKILFIHSPNASCFSAELLQLADNHYPLTDAFIQKVIR